jgi:hypothetical protein
MTFIGWKVKGDTLDLLTRPYQTQHNVAAARVAMNITRTDARPKPTRREVEASARKEE